MRQRGRSPGRIWPTRRFTTGLEPASLLRVDELTPPIVQDTVVVALWPTSGSTAILQVPRTLLDCGSVMVNVTVEGPREPVFPPRFFSEAATTQRDPHADASTLPTI